VTSRVEYLTPTYKYDRASSALAFGEKSRLLGILSYSLMHHFPAVFDQLPEIAPQRWVVIFPQSLITTFFAEMLIYFGCTPS